MLLEQVHKIFSKNIFKLHYIFLKIHGSTNYEDYNLQLLRNDMRIHSTFSAQMT